MKTSHVMVFLLTFLGGHFIQHDPIVSSVVGCTPAQVNTVNTVATDVVDAAEFGCIMTSTFVTAPEVVLACKIVDTIDKATPALLSFVDSLIAQRETLKQAGFAYNMNAAKWEKK